MSKEALVHLRDPAATKARRVRAEDAAPAPRKRAPGAGRKPLEGGAVSVNLTLTPAHRDQLKALGGSAWVRKMLDAVRAVEKKD